MNTSLGLDVFRAVCGQPIIGHKHGSVRFSDSLPPRVGFARRLVQVIRLPHQGLSICPLACSIVFFFSGLRGGSRESARHKPLQSRVLCTFKFSSTRSSVVSCIRSHLRTHLPAGETISKNWERNKGTAHAHAVKRFSLRLSPGGELVKQESLPRQLECLVGLFHPATVFIGVFSFGRVLLQVVNPSFTGAPPRGVPNPSAHAACAALSLAFGRSSTPAFALSLSPFVVQWPFLLLPGCSHGWRLPTESCLCDVPCH